MIGAGSLWGHPGKPLDLAIVLYVECTESGARALFW